MLALPTVKRCTKCGVPRGLTDFYRERRRPAGLMSACKPCHKAVLHQNYVANPAPAKERSRRWARENPDRVRQLSRAATLRKYGLTPAQFDILAATGCHVCGDSNRLCVDHDHATGLVRGVLCDDCNKSLGLLRDDADRILRLGQYVRQASQALGMGS